MAEKKIDYNDIRQIRTTEEKKVEKAIKGEVIETKRGAGSKLKEAFGLADGRTVGDYILYDILVPACKNTIIDMVNGGLNTLFGGSTRASNIIRDRGRSYISYENCWRGGSRRDIEPSYSVGRKDIKNMAFSNRDDAVEVLHRMVDIIEEFGCVSVNDFYDLIGVTGDWTDDNYGWTTLHDAYIEPMRGKFIIRFPVTRPLPKR